MKRPQLTKINIMHEKDTEFYKIVVQTRNRFAEYSAELSHTAHGDRITLYDTFSRIITKPESIEKIKKVIDKFKEAGYNEYNKYYKLEVVL